MSALHARIAETILERIERGELKVGDKLPPEALYSVELGVSRSTLRLAFAELERLGVLLRRKRFGTQIISDRPKTRFNMNTTGLHDVLSLGRDTELSDLRTRSVPTGDVPQLEGCDSETGHWLEVTGIRVLPGAHLPFNVGRVYVPARYAGIEPLLNRTAPAVYRVIEETFGIAVARVSQTATAIACPEEEARIMGLETGAPVLRIDAYLHAQDGSLMEVSVSTFDPRRFQIRTDVDIG